MALLTDALPLPSKNPARYTAVRHRPRGWQWIDPEKAAKGAILAIKHGLGTRTGFLAEQGEDVEEVFRELAAEQELAAELGVSIDGEIPPDDKLTEAEWKAQAEEAALEEPADGNGDGREAEAATTGTVARLESATWPPAR